MAEAAHDLEIARAVDNLLKNCAGMQPGESVLILEEDPALGHYEADLGTVIAQKAGGLGIAARRMSVPFNHVATDPASDVLAAMASADHILYLARLGDQGRFQPLPKADRSVVSYALDRAQLASAFGTVPHQAMVALKQMVNTAMAGAREIRVTCPLGSDFRGSVMHCDQVLADVGIKRFPMSVFAPLPMAGFSGHIALARFLIGTGSIYYDPFMLKLGAVNQVHFAGTHVQGFSGPEADRIRVHVERVAGELKLNGNHIHSWHVGLHPGCRYAGRAEDNPGRWGGSAFGNPRLLHVHTCGTYAPGEICWNVLDPTIALDGVPLWDKGRLYPERLIGGARFLAEWPDLAALFDAPAREMGIE